MSRLPVPKRVTRRVTVLDHFACPLCRERIARYRDEWARGASVQHDKPTRRTFEPCGCVAERNQP